MLLTFHRYLFWHLLSFSLITAFSTADWKQRIVQDSTVVRFFTFQIIQWPKQVLHAVQWLFYIITVTIKINVILSRFKYLFKYCKEMTLSNVCVCVCMCLHLLNVQCKAINTTFNTFYRKTALGIRCMTASLFAKLVKKIILTLTKN